MNAEIKQAWLAALRSGEYQQGQGKLRNETEDGRQLYCCLGVLCDLHARTVYDLWAVDYYDGDQSGLPDTVRRWAGLEQRYPRLGDIDITFYNDGTDGHSCEPIRPHTFAEIADLIERHL